MFFSSKNFDDDEFLILEQNLGLLRSQKRFQQPVPINLMMKESRKNLLDEHILYRRSMSKTHRRYIVVNKLTNHNFLEPLTSQVMYPN